MGDSFVLLNINKNIHDLAPKLKQKLANEIGMDWENVFKNMRDDLIQ